MPVALGLTALLSLSAPAAAHDSRQSLGQAILLFENFEDAKAEAIFRALLRHSPSRAMAGKAHLYLGLIAMNQLDSDRAMEEFKAALLVEPALDFVRGGSPKARLAFEEARHALEGQLRSSEPETPARPAAAPPAAPEAAVSSPAPPPAGAAKPRSSHALAITLGAVGVVAAGLGIYGGVDVLDYNSQVSSTHGGTLFTPQLQSAQSQAGFWAVAWIPFAVAGALGLGAGVLTW